MSAAELLVELQHRGVQVTSEGDRLKVRAPKGTITPDVRQRLMVQKQGIIGLLNMPADVQLMNLSRRACSGSDVAPGRLAEFLAVAADPEWATEQVAQHIARRLSEGLLL